MCMTTMQMACKAIARAVKKAGIANLYGGAETSNASGDDVKKLDILSNDIMTSALINSHTKRNLHELVMRFLFTPQEIRQLHNAARGTLQQDVGRFEVAVNDFEGVDVF